MIAVNTDIEVTEKQYKRLMNKCAGIVAGRIDENGNHIIQIWLGKYIGYVKEVMDEKD